MTEAEVKAHEIEVRREPLTSQVATALILALNAELTARYPEDRSADHFELDADEVAPGRGVFLELSIERVYGKGPVTVESLGEALRTVAGQQEICAATLAEAMASRDQG